MARDRFDDGRALIDKESLAVEIRKFSRSQRLKQTAQSLACTHIMSTMSLNERLDKIRSQPKLSGMQQVSSILLDSEYSI